MFDAFWEALLLRPGNCHVCSCHRGRARQCCRPSGALWKILGGLLALAMVAGCDSAPPKRKVGVASKSELEAAALSLERQGWPSQMSGLRRLDEQEIRSLLVGPAIYPAALERHSPAQYEKFEPPDRLRVQYDNVSHTESVLIRGRLVCNSLYSTQKIMCRSFFRNEQGQYLYLVHGAVAPIMIDIR
jgi:hypothetical protein